LAKKQKLLWQMPNHFAAQLPGNEPILNMEEENKNNPKDVGPIEYYFFEIVEQVGKGRKNLGNAQAHYDANQNRNVFKRTDLVAHFFLILPILKAKAVQINQLSLDKISFFTLSNSSEEI
jgi:hypothetical protein